MSQTVGYITANDKKSILAASSASSNSAPVLIFSADSRYISFNNDNTITITAGTYSNPISITSSDGLPFLTNVIVNLTSSGFTFDPPSVFLKQGDGLGQFRIGADSSLFPISYFYDTTKSEEVFTYYTITKNNNIRVTNTPIQVSIPSSISIPAGGCSTPFTINIGNPPTSDVLIIFNYDNQRYNETVLYPNQHFMKSQLTFGPTVTQNAFSFCVSSNFLSLGLPATFVMRFAFAGSNYKSYAFTPTENVTITIGAAIVLPASPSVSIILINRQKTFLDFNITTSVPGTVFYHLELGQNVAAMDITELQVKVKNNNTIVESMNDFLSYVYTGDRDKRVGFSVRSAAGQFTLRQSNMLPERYYTFCAYLETFSSIITAPTCISVSTQSWGVILKSKLTFSRSLDAFSLNKVLCYFAKSSATQVIYAVDLEGNSCYNRAVQNLHYTYPGTTFSSETSMTNIYLITNPYLTSDPSPTAFGNMYDVTSQISSASLSSALSGFAINYISSSTYIGSFNAISLISSSNADSISISFD